MVLNRSRPFLDIQLNRFSSRRIELLRDFQKTSFDRLRLKSLQSIFSKETENFPLG